MRVDSLLEVALSEEALPGARVVHRGQIVMDKSVGTLDGTSPVTPNTIYDLASVTKVAVTANALMRMAAEGDLEVDDPLRSVMPRLEDHPLGGRTVREVLTPQAGLEPWIPFYLAALEDSSGVFGQVPTPGCDIEITPELYLEEAYTDSVWAMILGAELKPPGKYKYSDLGFYVWMDMFAERGMDLETWFQREVAAPLGGRAWATSPWNEASTPQPLLPRNATRCSASASCVEQCTIPVPPCKAGSVAMQDSSPTPTTWPSSASCGFVVARCAASSSSRKTC